MAPDDRDARPPDDQQRSERESEFSRREMLRAGSAIPLVLSAGWLAACGDSAHGDSHGDHTDAPHNDANHTDSHTDGGSHSDSSGHTDTGHSDGGGHSDTPKHSDGGGHSDTPKHTDNPNHGDRVIHDDVNAGQGSTGSERVHTDRPGQPSHTDTFHQDSTVHVDN